VSKTNGSPLKWDNCELTLASEREGRGAQDSPAYKVSLISKAVRVASVAKAAQEERNGISPCSEEADEEDSFTIAEKYAENFAKAHELPQGTPTSDRKPTDKLLTEIEEAKEFVDETEAENTGHFNQDKEDTESETSEEYELVFPEQYHSDETSKAQKLVEEFVSQEGKIQRIYDNGKKEVIFPNGVKREVWPDGYQVVFFQNNDIKQSFKGGKICYFFAEAKTTQTTFPDGMQVFKFQNKQTEKHYPDGTKEISFPDGTVKCLYPDGEEESIFPDGTIQKIEKSGVRCIEYPHG
jgi:hypothetical protein